MANSKLLSAIESAAELGSFGDNFKLVSVTPSTLHGEDHFASDVVFAEVKLQNGSSEKSIHVVIKQQQETEFLREMMNTDAQFYNEALMYNEIFPSLDKNGVVSEIFPKLFYGRATLGASYEDDIIVVEDLRQFGYRLTQEKIFLDFNHCELVLKTIAKYHALSYVKKHEDIDEFLKAVGKVREVKYLDKFREDSNKFFANTIYRGVEPLEKELEDYETILGKFREKFNEPFTMMKSLVQPTEPVAVLCHGDFCRNNMVFRYDEKGNPIDVRFFDVATARYASPAIDLVFFLLMNTSTDLRRDHWDDLLNIYHEALSTAVTPECSIPSLEDIRQEVTSKALYGYTLCSFFIPMMMEPKDRADYNDFSSMDPEEIAKFTRSRGGEKATKVVADIIRDLIKLNAV